MEKKNESPYHYIAVCIESFLGALAEEERYFKKFVEFFASKEGFKLDTKDEIGFMSAKDIFIIALYCNDCHKLKDNINILMKLIKKEERTFNNIITVLTELFEKNVNNCQKFLNIQEINEICALCEDISNEENEEEN
jgi:hypothetical protein